MNGKIHVFPAWEQNPYLNMLYVGARAEGWRIEGSKGFEAMLEATPELITGDIFHIHWTSPILKPGASHREASRALAKFRAALNRMKENGVHIIWTVHNAMTHNTTHQDLEVRLAEMLADLADRVIQLNSGTREAVAEFYDLPLEKVVTLRHASYSGIYSDSPTQTAARARLGISTSARVVGFVGQMRAYKGIPTLLRAVATASRDVHDLTLILAGKTPPEDLPLIERELPLHVPTTRSHSFIADGDIATWFSACDVLVFPYERVLNSGSILLSATFGRPCILPAEPHLIAEYGSESWVSFYDPLGDASKSLAQEIVRSLKRDQSVRDAAARFAQEYSTLNMAWDYVSIINEMTQSTDERRSSE